jgi:hypothetical protein
MKPRERWKVMADEAELFLVGLVPPYETVKPGSTFQIGDVDHGITR